MPDIKQSLKDFVVTSNSGKYATEEELFSKFPELKGYDIQILRDFVATSNSGKYATEEELFSKFPEFNIKKKDESQVTSQEVATGSITKEEKQPTLSDASESKFDYESFIDKDEEYALPELEKILTGKGYSIEKTGLGDALLVTDNITGESTEIDLQPISWFGNDKYKKEEISKVKKLIETPSDSKRKALSANQLEAYSEDKIAYIENLKRLYPDFQFEYEQGPENGVSLKITKGSSVYQTLGEFSIPGKDAKQFSEINNFLYQNMTDEEASSIIKKQEADEYKRIVEEFSKIEDEIDISMESAEADFFNENYFKGLFSALEKAGIEIPDEARKELESGKVLKETYNPMTGAATTQVNMDATDVNNGIQKYFSNNPVAMDAINKYNLSGTIIKRKDKIDRAKKLAIEKLLEDSPGRESTKEILRRVNKDASEEQLRIETNLEMASSNLNKLVSSVKQSAEQIAIKYPGINIEVIEDGEGRLVDIISSEPVKEIDDLKREIKDAKDVYVSLANKSKYDYDKIASKAETTEKYIELSNKSYDLFDTAMADLNNALRQLAGGIGVVMTLAEGGIEEVTGVPVGIPLSSDVKMQMIRKDMAESREKLDKAYKTSRTYQEAIKEGSKFEFATRQVATQTPNIALAIGTSGGGAMLGLSVAARSTLVSTAFGVTSAGQKYDELTTRQEIASIAEQAKKDLEAIKDMIPEDEYFSQMYELERAIEDGKIDFWQKTLAVTGTGLVEGLVSKYIGTIPNSVKVLKDLKGATNFMDDILRSNYKATLGAFKEIGKRTRGEILEEMSIDALTQVNDYAFLGDQIDLSSLDDVAVTSIITSGAMNTPSTAYSTIMTQTNVNRYKNKIKSLTGEIATLKDMLSDPDLTNIQRASIHSNINSIISQVADQTTNMEGDALLMGADNIKEMLTLSGVRNSMLKKAEVESDDSYDVANAKIDNYLKGLDQDAAKKFTDQMKYIDGRRNEILKSINYEGAVERVFGEKGTEISKDLDPTLTPQQKYVEVYKQVRQEINDNALKEFNDAIQEQETGDISDAKPAEGVQEMEEGVREPSVQEETQEVTPNTFIEVDSPIQDNLQDNETIVQTREDNKGRVFTTTKQESVRERDGIKITKFKFNRSDKSTDQRNDTFAPEEVALEGTNYEINPEDRIKLEEGQTATYEISEIREGETGAAASVKITTFDTDGNQIGSFQGDVTLVEKTDTEQDVAEEEINKVADKAGVTPKNLKDLYKTGRDMFGLNKVQAFAQAVAMDRMVGAMAKRKGVKKADIYKTLEFRKGKLAPSGALKQEATSIWKSTTKEGINKIQQKAATPEQWVKMINDKGGKGTSQELEWIGLADFLSDYVKENNAKSVPKEVVEQYINDNQIEIVEVTKSFETPKLDFKEDKYSEGKWQAEDPTGTFSGDYTIQWLRDESKFELESADGFISLHNSFEEAVDRANEHISTNQVGVIDGQTKYSQYTLEGGENYREVLLTLPVNKKPLSFGLWVKNQYGVNVSSLNEKDLKEAKDEYELEKSELRRKLPPFEIWVEEQYGSDISNLNGYDLKEAEKQYELEKFTEKNYKSSHWDEANILAHLRINERTLPNGERVMFIEEVQSDWAQEGKKKGFEDRKKKEEKPTKEQIIKLFSDVGINVLKPDDAIKNLTAVNITPLQLKRASEREEISINPDSEIAILIGKIEDSFKDEATLAEKRLVDSHLNKIKEITLPIKNAIELYTGKVNIYNNSDRKTPDMPYKKTDQWVGMAMRRVFKMAADEGFDRVAWVTGEQSADRYDLTKQVDRIEVGDMADGNRSAYVALKGNTDVQLFIDPKTGVVLQSSNKALEGNNLSDVVGKEMSEKILTFDTDKGRVIDGEGLKVGGEGMKTFYNSILPKVAKKEAQRFDKKAKVDVIDFKPKLTKEENAEYDRLIAKVEIDGIESLNYDEQTRFNELAEKETKTMRLEEGASKQLSIPITPEMRMNLNSAVPLFQSTQGAMLAEDGNYIIYALTNPNVSTPLHEMAHVFEHYLTEAERNAIVSWAGTKGWTIETSEKFARGFERYLAEGKAPTTKLQKLFDRFKEWLTDIYNGILGSDIDIELNDKMKSIYDSMLDTEQVVSEEVDERAYKPEEVKETTDAAAFAASQAEAIAQRKDDKLQVTPLTQQDAQKIIDEGGKLFMTEDGKAGAYVTADGYMGGLFKQPGANRTQAAKVLQDARIKAGGKFFDAFGINTESGKGTTLEDIYIKNGFRPVARMTFNPDVAPKGWEKTNLKNRPDNVFFVYDPTYKATKGEGQRIEDYDKAYELAKNKANETKAGNRLFNEPLKAVKEIADRYYERVFKKERPRFEGTRELDVERAKKISDAFEAMKNDPNNPEVKKAYEALAKETIEQYKDFIDAGYVVEINNEEPYANSAEMIEDLRVNKRIKIFSTESGFGDNKITDRQRSENPLLRSTEFTDTNGVPMLVNDLFRAIHDFYGHAELGNSFGPKGEENAWNVHARMFSPLARRAMTTETRGQNSYVNFSGVNEKVDALRDKARKLREQGKDAESIVNKIYELTRFADQKVGLLPEEFSTLDTEQDAIESEVEKLREMFKAPDQRKQVDNALNALSKIAPDVRVILHESEQAYAEATNEQNRSQKTAGEYNYQTKTIHINPEKANVRTVAHETFHAILLNMVKTDAEAQRLTKAMIKAVYKSAPADLKKLIDDFAESKNADGSNNYDLSVQNEERLAELIGYLATKYDSLTRPTQNVIKRWLDRLAKMFGLKPFTDTEVIDVLNTIAGKVARGEAITQQDLSPISQSDVESRAGRMSRKQMQDLFLSKDKPNLKSTKDVAKFLDGWSKESTVFDQDVKNISDQEIEDRFVDHLVLELTAWEKVRKDDYISFYDDDIAKNTNPTLQSYAEKEYGRRLTDTEVKLYHLVSAFASPSANPEMDSWKGFDIFDRFIKTGELSGYSDKIATVWETLPGGRRVDTGVPRTDEQGRPMRSKVTPAYSQTGLDKFNSLIDKMGGDIDKAMGWITSEHSYSEIAKMFGYPEKGAKALKENEYLSKEDGGIGVFGMTGAKLGSYILNRFGNFSTVTKDMWYARTMARLAGQDLVDVNASTKKEGAIKTPWSESTKEGRRMRSIADMAFKRVGEVFNTSPAMIQERIWDFEKRLYEMLGANEDAAYTSDGLKKGIERSKPSTFSPRKQIVGRNANLSQEAKDNYYRAIELTKLGKTPKDIRLLTGWEIGKDKKWRYEMFDGDAKIKTPIEELSIGKTYKLKDVLDFPEMYDAYPSVANLDFQLNTRLNADGQYQSENKRLVMNPDKLKGDSVETISTMLHELQHAVQEKEGFARGTSEEQARAKLKEEYLRQKYEKLNPFRRFREILGLPFTSTETLGESLANLERIADKSDFDIYERAAGEVEARNVEVRRTMTESERLNTLLSDTENISRDDQFIIRKQQVTNNEIIQRAKEAGISDAAIRKYLQDDKGLSIKQADDAVRLYNEKLRKEGLKKEGVRVISGKNAKKLYNALMYVKSARANRPKSMVIGREDKAGAIEGAVKRAYNTIGKLDKIMKKMSKPEYERVMDELDKYLRGNKNANLPDNIKAVAFEMRTHLDNLSRKLIEVGAVPDVEFDNLPPKKKQELIDRAGSEADARAEYKTASENILGNIGEYLNRSYAVHTDKNWKDKVSEKVVEDAKNYLRKSMAKTVEIQAKKENRDFKTMLEQEVNAVVDRLLDPNESRAFFSSGSTDAKKTGILTRRLDIAPEIRALTGEETSPAKNYIISVQKIASLAAQQTFLNNVRETGLGVWLFENEADAPKGFRTRIASETSKTMNPLNGLYTSPEIAKAFNDTYKNPEGIAGDVIKLIEKIYLKPIGAVKYSKTILSPGTHSKNIIGNGFFMVANGYLNPKDFYDAGRVVFNEIKNGDNEALREKYIEYIEAGVINSSVALKELKNILTNKVETEQDFEKLVQDRLYGKNALKKVAEKAEMAYQIEDDYFKIVSYEINKRQYSKALFKDSFKNLTDKQQKEVKDIVKEITKNTLPNYERIAKIRDLLKYIPIGSNFLSFHMEALRVSYNTIELAIKEVKDPRTAAIGVRRLAGISAVVMFSSGLLGSLLGFGGDDEDEEDAVRKLLPYYSENSKINIVSTSGNNIIYQDLSASSPYGAIEKAFIAYSRGESLDESIIGSLKEALGPFYADDILISEFMKAYDVTSSQGLVSREGGEAIAKFFYNTLKPGAITSSEKVFIDDRMSILDAAFGREIKLKEQGKLKEAFGQFTGFGYRTVKKDAVLKRKLYEIASVGFGEYKSGKARAASMDYSNRAREFKDGKVSEAEVEDAYKRSNKMYKEAINEAIEIYKSGLTLDISNEKMKELMKSTGFSKDEIEYISRGETPEMKRKESELSEYEKLLKKRSKR